MTDRETFLATVLDNPSDDTVRLVLADLLRESEDVGEQARGRFLWAGVTAAGFTAGDLIEDHLYYTAQAELATVTVAGDPARWLGCLGFGPSPLVSGDWFWDFTHDRVTIRIGDVLGVYARGMLRDLSVPLGDWFSVAADVVAEWPIELATITDVPGLKFLVERTVVDWCLTARLDVPGRRVPMAGSVVPLGMSPFPNLTDPPTKWWVEERFRDRSDLVTRIALASAALVHDLRETAGDRWPPPPRKRR